MSDIFISYASEDRPRAAAIAKALEAEGWSVWWDRNIPAGKRFDDVIDEEIKKARCLVVLWSGLSVKKDWVLEEAEDGKKRGVLVPVMIEAVEIPRGFRRIEAADLAAWGGGNGEAAFRALRENIAALLEPAPTGVEKELSPEPKQQFHVEWAPSKAPAPWFRWRWAAIGVTVVAVVVLALQWTHRPAAPVQESNGPTSSVPPPEKTTEAPKGGDTRIQEKYVKKDETAFQLPTEKSKIIPVQPAKNPPLVQEKSAPLVQESPVDKSRGVQETPKVAAPTPTAPPDDLARGIELANSSKCQEAIGWLQKGLVANPQNAQALATLGGCLLETGDSRGAYDALSEAIKIDQSRDQFFVLRAGAAFAMGQYSLASRDIDQALKLNNRQSIAYSLRGDVFMKLAQYGDAAKAYKYSLDLANNASVCRKYADAIQKNGNAELAQQVRAGCPK
jgi:hypothetical protein